MLISFVVLDDTKWKKSETEGGGLNGSVLLGCLRPLDIGGGLLPLCLLTAYIKERVLGWHGGQSCSPGTGACVDILISLPELCQHSPCLAFTI